MSHTWDVVILKNEIASVGKKVDLAISLLLDRAQPNLSQAEFARKTGLSRSTISRYVASGKIKSSRGRVLFSELSKFRSRSLSLTAESQGNSF